MMPVRTWFSLPPQPASLSPPSAVLCPPQDNNAVVKEWGQKRNEETAPEKMYSHVDLVQLLDIVDLEAGAEVAGACCACCACCLLGVVSQWAWCWSAAGLGAALRLEAATAT